MEADRIRQELRELLGRIYGKSAAGLGDQEAIFGGPLGLDSLDSMAFVVAIEERFGVLLRNDAQTRKAFSSLESLGLYLQNSMGQGGSAS